MGRQWDSETPANVKNRGETDRRGASGWTTDTELVREFERPVNVVDAVSSTVEDAIGQWPELSQTPPLYQFVEVENLDGLFNTKSTGDSKRLPSAEFQFQSSRVTLLYGLSIRVIIERDR
jgi:hypothetical protein